MNAAFYENFRGMAVRLLSDKGAQRPIYRFVNVVDSVAGTAAVTATGFQLHSLALPASKATGLEVNDIRIAELLVRGDVRFILAAAKGALFDPQGTDVMFFNGNYWVVMGNSPIDPDGTGAVIYKFHVEKTNLNAAQRAAIAGVTL